MTSRADGGARPRALVVGTGLIGGSIALSLRQRGWHVAGLDADEDALAEALHTGVIDQAGDDLEAQIVFVATPATAVAEEVGRILATPGRRHDAVVTDVSGVKTAIVEAADHPRFIGGHPMAGSEQIGLRGAAPDLFEGAVWVLTPTSATDLDAFDRLQGVVTELGADVLVLTPDDHDRLVAVVSHVPHLVAATLMNAATVGAEQNGALLRLAAGGFRDMTRVAAGHPGIWPDICSENAGPIVDALEALVAELTVMRDRVAGHDRAADLRGAPAGQPGPAQPSGPHRPPRQPLRAPHPGARPPRRPGRDHVIGGRRGHQHLRHRDRPLGRGPARRPHPGRRRGRGRSACATPSRPRATTAAPRSCRDGAPDPGGATVAWPAGARCARRGRSRSRTGPSCSPLWPRAPRSIYGLSDGADVAASLAAVEAMGVGIERAADGSVTLHGGRSLLHQPRAPLDCGNSGTSMRLLAGLVAGFDWETG